MDYRDYRKNYKGEDQGIRTTELIADTITGDIHAGAGSIGTAELADDGVTNDKLANITRGSVKVGGTANAPTDLVAKSDGYILIGDGTDVKSVAVSGVIAITNAGVTSLSDNAVTKAKVGDDAIGKVELDTEEITVTVTTGNTAGTGTVTTGSEILGYYPAGNQDQFVDNIEIAGTTLTITLAAAATADNTFKVKLLKA